MNLLFPAAVAAALVVIATAPAPQFPSGDAAVAVPQAPELSVVDPGVPRIQWYGPRTVKVYGHELVLNGFRFGGHSSKARAAARPLTTANGLYDYDSHVEGFSMPALSPAAPEMWVAAFAVAARAGSAPARIAFVPFLKVVERSGDVVTFAPHAGAMAPGFYAGAEVLVCSAGGQFSYHLTTITANTASSVTLADAPAALAAGDSLLPAPGLGVLFKYLRSLKLDYSPAAPGSPAFGEWRNFVFRGGRTYSQTGNPWGTFSATWQSKRRLDLRDFVSPLATGVFGVAQAHVASGTAQPAYVTVFDDGVHYIAHVGDDRAVPPSDGLSSMFEAPFFWGQEIWVALNGTQQTGAVTILGWMED